MKNYIQSREKIQGKLCFQRKRKLLKNPECKKYIPKGELRQLYFSRQAQSFSKILNVKDILNTVKNFRSHSVFRASARCSKILNKKYIQYSEKIQDTLFFHGKRMLLKNPECKKYIQYSEKFQGTRCFSGQAQMCSKILNIKSIFNTVKNFRAHFVFKRKRNVLKNPDVEKYIQYGEKFQGTLCFSGQAQMCSKILNVKSIFNTVKNFRAHAVFQGKCKLLKNPKCKKSFL